MFELAAKRSILRPVSIDDSTALHELWTSAGVRRFLWDNEVISTERTLDAIKLSQQSFEKQGFGLWVARPYDAAELIGFGGLWPFREPPENELLYGVAVNCWNRGYATEIAQAVVNYCLRSLEMPMVQASTDVDNAASIRVLEKLGFQLVRREVVGGLDTVFYDFRNR